MEDSCLDFQWLVNSGDDQLNSMATFGDNMPPLRPQAPSFEYYEPVIEPSTRPAKQLKTHTGDYFFMNQNLVHGSDFGITNQDTIVKPKEEAFPSSNGFTCNNLPSSHSHEQNNYAFSKGCQADNCGGTKSISTRVAPYQDHILAERKRREIVSQRFIALSALLPNLKKLDKASVLGDAIDYMKALQEKVKMLEEQMAKKTNTQSETFEMEANGADISSSDEKFSHVSQQLPEIKARFSGKNVLIRVHCKKKPGVVENTLAEIEKLHLSVISSSVAIFANYALHITVTAQMDEDVSMTVKDFVNNLSVGLKQFM